MRVLVTGSRDWTDYRCVKSELTKILVSAESFTLVHGDCKEGVDAHADTWAKGHHPNVIVERWPADWELHGKAAGPKRNQAMARSGLDLVLAFIVNDSRGASGCLHEALGWGVPARVWRQSYEVLRAAPKK